MSRKQKKGQDSKPVPLRVPEDMQKRIRALANKSRLSDADVMRMAIDRGIGSVEDLFKPAETQAA